MNQIGPISGRVEFLRVLPPTEHGAGSRFEGLTLQTLAVQEAAVGGAGVPGEVAGPVQSAQEQEHRALVVAHKVRLTCRTNSSTGQRQTMV